MANVGEIESTSFPASGFFLRLGGFDADPLTDPRATPREQLIRGPRRMEIMPLAVLCFVYDADDRF